MRFHFVLDVVPSNRTFPADLADGQGRGVHTCAGATGMATTALLLDRRLHGGLTRDGGTWSLVLLLDKSG